MTEVKYPKLRIGFLGHGNMFQALSNGFVKSNQMRCENIIASNRRLTEPLTTDENGYTMVNSNSAVLQRCDYIIIAVKPHIVESVLKEVRDHIQEKHLFVSIAAGLTIDTLEKWLPGGARVVRTMPNTPVSVGCGVTVLSAGTHATPADMTLTQDLFSSVGLCEVILERLIDSSVGVSGSGPAYIFMMIEALSDGGVKMGLGRELSTKLAAQMVMGAAKMVLESGKHPGELKDAVCSPGGATIEAVHELEKGGLRATTINAVQAASEKAAQLGQKNK